MTQMHEQNKKILLVYDNPEYCELLEHEFTRLCFDVHTSRSLETALMMIAACQKIGTSYQWILAYNDLQDLTCPDFIELQNQQQLNHFDIIYFHDSLSYINVGKISNKTNHVIPFSKKSCFNTFIAAIKEIISRKDLLDSLSQQAQNRKKKPQILLVEDNDIGRLMAKTILESLNLEVTETCNGQEGLNALDHHHYDLVLTDIFMPVMNGLDLVRTIRKSGRHQLPIIVMSANADNNWAESFFAGADGFLVKPFSAEVLRRELDKWLSLTSDEKKNLPPKTTTLIPDLKHLEHCLDLQAALNRTGGKADVYLTLLKHYYENYQGFSEQLVTTLKKNQRQQAIHQVHSLRGAAGNLGAVKVELLAGKLEHDLSRLDLNPAPEALLREHEQLLVNLSHCLLDVQQEEQRPIGTITTLVTLLNTLPPLLQQHKAREIKEMEQQLATCQWPEPYGSAIDTLLKQIRGFQYQQAANHLNQFLSQINLSAPEINP